MTTIQGITIKLHTLPDGTHRVDLSGPDVGDRRAAFTPPYSTEEWLRIAQGLEPTFEIERESEETKEALRDLGYPGGLHQTIGAALAEALLADEDIAGGFDLALGLARAARQQLPVELRFGGGSDALAALPWELLNYQGRFLVRECVFAPRGPQSAAALDCGPTRAEASCERVCRQRGVGLWGRASRFLVRECVFAPRGPQSAAALDALQREPKQVLRAFSVSGGVGLWSNASRS